MGVHGGCIIIFFTLTALVPIWMMVFLYYGPNLSHNWLSWSFAHNQWKTFNWHPLLMSLSFGMLFPQAAVSFRILHKWTRHSRKLFHVTCQTLAVIFSSIAFAVAVRFKTVSHNDGFYTVHTWVGVASYACFLVQWVYGFTAFFFPKLPESIRAATIGFHRAMGSFILLATTASILSGVMSYQFLFAAYFQPSLPPYGFFYRMSDTFALLVLLTQVFVQYHLVHTQKPGESGGGYAPVATQLDWDPSSDGNIQITRS